MYYENRFDNPNSEGRLKLKEAFKLLRKQKMIALQNFSCCGSCGSYEISVMGDEKGKKAGIYPAGYVFYHRQDTDTLKNNGAVYLRYGNFSNKNDRTRKGSLETKEVGKLIVKAMKTVGLETEWDGDTGHCILVNVEGVNMKELK